MFENLRQIWERASVGARSALALGIVVILAGAGWLGYQALRSDYQVLFADLDPRDEAAILAELDRMKVPYVLGPDGTSILVDAQQVHATRIRLMGKGVNLQGGVGFELFNNTDFGMTEFAQKINYQRALQGELARTIMALDEVKYARVHLVLPESGLLKRSKQAPKASISLAMRDGRTLAPEQVLGIQRLVAAAVPEIDAGSVTIVDQRGVALTRPAENAEDDSGAASRLSLKGDLEKDLTRKVVAVLDRAFGPGQAIVSVDVTLNTDQVRITREDVVPMGRQGTEPTGVITRRRNVQRGGEGEKDNREGSSTAEVEYQSGRRVEQIISRPGTIRRLSVAVLLPRTVSDSKMKEIRQIVSMAAGLSPARGDEIAISSVEGFAAPQAAADAPPAAETPAPRQRPPAQAGGSSTGRLLLAGIVVALLAGLLIGVVGTRRQLRDPRRRAALGKEERERVLAEMREWLRTEPHPQGERRA